MIEQRHQPEMEKKREEKQEARVEEFAVALLAALCRYQYIQVKNIDTFQVKNVELKIPDTRVLIKKVPWRA